MGTECAQVAVTVAVRQDIEELIVGYLCAIITAAITECVIW